MKQRILLVDLNPESTPGESTCVSPDTALSAAQSTSASVSAAAGLPSVELGTIVGCDTRGRPIVSWSAGLSIAPARVVWMPLALDWNVCRDLRVALAFESGDPTRPIIVGLLDEPPIEVIPHSPNTTGSGVVDPELGRSFPNGAQDSVSVQDTGTRGAEPVGIEGATGTEPAKVVGAVQSGSEAAMVVPDMLRLAGERELVLECGKSRIALRADGRIVIEGGYLLSRSTGVNKIMGGSVQLN